MALTFEHLRFTVKERGADGKLRDRAVVDDISGFACAGEVAAVSVLYVYVRASRLDLACSSLSSSSSRSSR